MRHRLLINAGILLSFLVFAHISNAQKDIRRADKQLELKAYELAIKNYKAYLEQNPDNSYAQVKLAESYRSTNSLMKAVVWYEKAFSHNEDLDPAYRLNYAHSLKKLGLYEKAKMWYRNYMEEDETVAQTYLDGCDAAIELLKEEDRYAIEPFDGNSENSDFGFSLFGENVVFASFRKDVKRNDEKRNLSYIQNIGNQLFITPHIDRIVATDLRFLRPELKEIYWLGPITYSEDLKTLAYTKNNFSDGAIQVDSQEPDLSIYLASTESNGDFSREYRFPYNQVEFSYAFPNLAFNGSALYFSSNRPGGLGGFDIYVSYLKEKEWSKPENLGPAINTAANEITPFYKGDKIYFSSDAPKGLGGYDVYGASVSEGKWSKAYNMGKGINSPADDYYLIEADDEIYYFTSSRLGGKGKDDIYKAFEKSAQDITEESITPEAVQLDALAAAKEEIRTQLSTEKNIVQAEQVAVSESEEVVFAKAGSKEDYLLDNKEDFKLYDHYELELRGAKKAGTTDIVDPTVTKYFIQLASLSRSKGNVDDFANLSPFGKIYRFYMSTSTKIRLGSFDSKIDADMALAKVRRAGYNDAFITSAVLADANYELLAEGEAIDLFTEDDLLGAPEYKVRLASYSDPLWFDTKELQYLDGELEQWTKGYWTIFILSGFQDLERAEAARIKAVNRGFKEAEVVVDDRGILKKVNKN